MGMVTEGQTDIADLFYKVIGDDALNWRNTM